MSFYPPPAARVSRLRQVFLHLMYWLDTLSFT